MSALCKLEAHSPDVFRVCRVPAPRDMEVELLKDLIRSLPFFTIFAQGIKGLLLVIVGRVGHVGQTSRR
jgi:hypothetical protein